MKKTPKILFAIILVLLMMLPAVLAADDTQQNQDEIQQAAIEGRALGVALKNTGEGFAKIFQGDIGGALATFLSGGTVYLVGAFLVIFGLMQLITKMTIFKDDEHKKMRNLFSIGVALIGIVSPGVFNVIVKLLGGSFLTVGILLFVIFAIIMIISKLRSSSSQISAERFRHSAEKERAHADFIKEEGSRKKMDHEEGMERQLETKEASLITESEEIIEGDLKNASNLADQLHHMRNLLGTISGVPPDRQDQYKQSIMSRASAFTDFIHKGEADIAKLKAFSVNLQKIEFQEMRLKDDEAKTLAHWNAYFKDQIIKQHSLDPKNDADMIKNHFNTHIANDLKNLIYKAHALDVSRKDLLDKVTKYESDLVGRYNHLDGLRNNLISGLNGNNIPGAISAVDAAIVVDKQITEDVRNIAALEAKYRELTAERDHIDNVLKGMLRHARTTPI